VNRQIIKSKDYFHPKISKRTILRNLQTIYLFKIRNYFFSFFGVTKTDLTFTLVNGERGYFSLLAGFVDLIEYTVQLNLPPNVFIENSNYSIDKIDILESVFDLEYRADRESCKQNLYFKNSEELPRFRSTTSEMTLARAQEIVERYLVLNDKLNFELAKIMTTNPFERYIGIHWRGTDHFNEALPVTAEQIISEVGLVLSLQSHEGIEAVFIATDEKSKLEVLQDRLTTTYPHLKVFFTDAHRSKDGSPIHLKVQPSNFEVSNLTEQAMLDCLILSKSAVLIRVPSNLSAWCSVFNPKLSTVLLSRHNPGVNYFEWRWMY
jgi:hypothetical protein